MAEPIVKCVFGQRGGGKSTLARELVAEDRKVLAFDPQRDYCSAGWLNVTTREAVQEAILASASGGNLRVSYTPDFKRCDPVEEGAWMATAGDIAQMYYPADARSLTLLYDEAHLAYPVEKGRAAETGPIRAAVLQGRHRGIGLVFVTQRPANLATDARSQAAEIYIFRMMAKTDRTAVSAMHPRAGEILDKLHRYEFIRLTDSEISRCVLRHRAGVNTLEAL